MIQTRQWFFIGAILTLAISLPGLAAVQSKSIKAAKRPPAVTKTDLENLPVVRFETKSNDYRTYYTTKGIILAGFTLPSSIAAAEPPQYFELQILLNNALPNVEITTLNPRLAHNDFFGSTSPSWLTNIPEYARVKYANVYPDVDLLFQVDQHRLDLNFIIAPGGDPRKIGFHIKGAQDVKLTPQGTILMNAHDMLFELPKPQGYQVFDESSARSVVDARFVLSGKNEITLQIAPYDPKHTLIIHR